MRNSDDKRLQRIDEVTIYPYGTNAFKVYENKMLMVKDLFFEKITNDIVFKKHQLLTTHNK